MRKRMLTLEAAIFKDVRWGASGLFASTRHPPQGNVNCKGWRWRRPLTDRELSFRHRNPCTSARARLLADYYFDVAIQRVQEVHEGFHGKPVQAVIHQGRDFWLINVEQSRGRGLRQGTRLNDLVDSDRQTHSGLLFFGIAHAEIRKDIARPRCTPHGRYPLGGPRRLQEFPHPLPSTASP